MDEPEAVFVETLDPEVLHFGETKPHATVCAWCGQGLPEAALDVCPHCGALLKPSDEALDVPGVTTLGPEAVRMLEVAEEKRRRKAEPRRRAMTEVASPALATLPTAAAEEEAALLPPDAEVKRVMLELEASARRASEGPTTEAPPAPPEVPPPAEASAEPSAASPEPETEPPQA
jgi:hypothetical protein